MSMFEAWQYEFMRDALWMGSLIAAMCAVLSCFLVLRGWALMGDAVSHAVLPGIVIAYWCGGPLFLGAMVAGFFCAVGSGWVKRVSRIKEDTAMGVVFTGLFAMGLVLFHKVPSDLHLDHILFGHILGIVEKDKPSIVVISLLVMGLLWIKRRDLLFLLSVAIVVALKSVGLVLVTAMLITPGATAFLWTDRFDRMLGVAVMTAVLSTLIGLTVSFAWDASSSACMVLCQSGFFLLSWCFGPKHGLLRGR
ncbi:MAG: metal ABC transporter permease [Verrucomicrobia bacterium]|nr:MAG: metal ABC transporter permease [Verrucomicrobiota bacterium]